VPDPWHDERAGVWHRFWTWGISISHVSLGECPFCWIAGSTSPLSVLMNGFNCFGIDPSKTRLTRNSNIAFYSTNLSLLPENLREITHNLLILIKNLRVSVHNLRVLPINLSLYHLVTQKKMPAPLPR
jgi:hypothetical protein